MGKGILKKLIGTIGILQLVFFLMSINTQMPGNALSLLKNLKPIVTFDIIKSLSGLNKFVFEFDYKT